LNLTGALHDYSDVPASEPDMQRTAREIYDELLVLRCKRREVAAWEELVARWNDRLYYYLRRLIDHEPDAGNALQEVWVHALRGIHSLQDGSRVAPWLYTIARRAAMNHFRHSYACREESGSEAMENEIGSETDAELCLENIELVHFGLAKLGIPEREVLTLYFLEDLTVAEIADLLAVPVGTVKSRLFKARRDLRRILEQESQHHD
jgi:RNA polymerase sigma-70 factor (ECF subfamily)